MNLISFPGHSIIVSRKVMKNSYVSNEQCYWKSTNPDMALKTLNSFPYLIGVKLTWILLEKCECNIFLSLLKRQKKVKKNVAYLSNPRNGHPFFSMYMKSKSKCFDYIVL